MTKERLKGILLAEPKSKNAFMRHGSKFVKPFDFNNGLYEMEDTKTDFYLIGNINEAIHFLMS